MKLWVEAEALRLTNIRASQNRRAGNPGPEGSIAKLMFAEVNQRIYELCVDLLGPAALAGYDYSMKRLREPRAWSAHPGRHARCSSGRGPTRSRVGPPRFSATSWVSGCSGLPGDVRVDKDLPWSEVPR